MSTATVIGELLNNSNSPICCLCLNKMVVEDGMYIHDRVYLNAEDCSGSSVTMSHMIKSVLHQEEEDLVSNSVCNSCVISTVSAYKFIQMCEQATQRLTNFIDSITDVVTQHSLQKCHRIFIATELNTLNVKLYLDKKHVLPYHRNHSKIKRAVLRFQELSNPETLSKYICGYCGHVYHKRATLVDHLKKNCNKKPCNICGSFISQKSMRRHKRLCGKDLPESIPIKGSRYECANCGKQFRMYKDCEVHIQRDICSKTIIQDNINSKPFKCKICNAEYISNQALNTHLRIHSDNKNDYHECKWCLKRFPCPGQLKSHAVTHTKEKNFACDICGGTFVTRASLTYHYRRHTGEKPYECLYCDETFLSASRRRDHVLTRHLPKIQCKYCHRWFGQRSISGHLQRHYVMSNTYGKISKVYKVKSEVPES